MKPHLNFALLLKTLMPIYTQSNLNPSAWSLATMPAQNCCPRRVICHILSSRKGAMIHLLATQSDGWRRITPAATAASELWILLCAKCQPQNFSYTQTDTEKCTVVFSLCYKFNVTICCLSPFCTKRQYWAGEMGKWGKFWYELWTIWRIDCLTITAMTDPLWSGKKCIYSCIS